MHGQWMGSGIAVLGFVLANCAPGLAQSNVMPGPTYGDVSVRRAPPVERIYTPPETLSGSGPTNQFSTIPLRPTPIFMTSINYPGVYGAYYYGAAPDLYVPTVTQSQMTLAPTLPLPSTIPPVERIVRPGVASAPATITIYVPEGGFVWVQDQALPQSPTNQYVYQTPPLLPNQLYKYDVRATWTEEGQPVTDTRTVTVQSGEKHVIEFNRKTPVRPALRAIVPQER